MKQITFPGHELRLRREQLGVALEEAYRRTRVPVRLLEKLEKGDVEGMPEACFVVGFIRTYCEFLELNSARYVEQYRTCVNPPARFLGVMKRNSPDVPVKRPAWVANAVAWGGVCLVFAMGLLTYLVVVRPEMDGNPPRVEAESADLVLPPEDLDLQP
jgi:cytoskeleton protein RodZ